jgi:predicted RNase H-like nuclease (RuvC/YqgF family)
MTKQNLQKELLEKVKPGTKPSDIRKLKRSKSADDIPSSPPLSLSTPLNRSKSTEPKSINDPKYPYTTLISQSQELEQLRKESEAKSTTISLLRKKIGELEKSDPPNQLLQDQLKEKQKEVENLRKQLETANTELSILKQAQSALLDDNLTLKHQSLKD